MYAARAVGRRLLLDTHTLWWWFRDDPRLSRHAHAAIGHAEAFVVVSAASAWEIATKVRIGKLPDPHGLTESLPVHLASQGFVELPITVEHSLRAGHLPGRHKDPFDRILIAQAQVEGLTLVSNEAMFDSYDIVRLW